MQLYCDILQAFHTYTNTHSIPYFKLGEWCEEGVREEEILCKVSFRKKTKQNIELIPLRPKTKSSHFLKLLFT